MECRTNQPSKEATGGGGEGIRKGPWTMEEDLILINYIANHGEGVWNSLALSAGLKRTGKSCRLRWLNYLRPDVRRGNITLEEQILIMDLHSKWGNRWSKIAKHLPGRTDNEIKNYWRTRIQKHLKPSKLQSSSPPSSGVDHHHQLDTSHTSQLVSGYNHYYHGADPMEAMMVAECSGSNTTQSDQHSSFEGRHWSMEELWSMELFNAGS